MQTIDKIAASPAPLSFIEELAWNEFHDDRDTFFKRGSVVTVPLPPGLTLQERRALITGITARHDIFRTGSDTQSSRVHNAINPSPTPLPRIGRASWKASAPSAM